VQDINDDIIRNFKSIVMLFIVDIIVLERLEKVDQDVLELVMGTIN